jgi:deoxyhypusine synthase
VVKQSNNQSKSKPCYMVGSMREDITVSAMGREMPLSISGLADGCIGVSLWFDTYKNAEAYRSGEEEIIPGTYKPKEKS